MVRDRGSLGRGCGNPLGLVRRESSGSDTGNPQNGRDELARLVGSNSWQGREFLSSAQKFSRLSRVTRVRQCEPRLARLDAERLGFPTTLINLPPTYDKAKTALCVSRSARRLPGVCSIHRAMRSNG